MYIHWLNFGIYIYIYNLNIKLKVTFLTNQMHIYLKSNNLTRCIYSCLVNYCYYSSYIYMHLTKTTVMTIIMVSHFKHILKIL